MITIMIITIWALIIKFQQAKDSDAIMLQIINGTLILLITWMIIEGINYCWINYSKYKSTAKCLKLFPSGSNSC